MAIHYKKKYHMRTPEEKEKIVLEYLNGKAGLRVICANYEIGYDNFRKWIKKYKESGIDGLKSQTGKTKKPNSGRHKKGTEIEELKRELAKKDIEIERLKKGYTVKGVGARKEYVTTFDKNIK